MNAELRERLDAKYRQTVEMAWRLGAEGICVDEGDEHSLPVVEWFPGDAKNLLRLVADTGRLTQSDCDAVRKIADGVPVGEAYRIESCPSLYALHTDPRKPSEFMKKFYAEVSALMGSGMSEKQARSRWLDDNSGWVRGLNASENESMGQIAAKKRRKALEAKIGRFERDCGRKNLRNGSPT